MPTTAKPCIVILGSGFGAFSFLITLDPRHYDVVLISPCNHFLFTPLLPSTTVGTIEFRSIIEPVRTAQPGIRFLLAASETILLIFDAKLREYTAQRFRRKRFDWLKTAAFGRDISRF